MKVLSIECIEGTELTDMLLDLNQSVNQLIVFVSIYTYIYTIYIYIYSIYTYIYIYRYIYIYLFQYIQYRNNEGGKWTVTLGILIYSH